MKSIHIPVNKQECLIFKPANMEVNLKQAVKMFFSKSSFEMIFLESFANALDANATEFNIEISLSDYSELQNLVIKLSDNGVGFDDKRFYKFSKLFEVEERSHKGLGRLVYLCYFDKIEVESVFEKNKLRKFIFHEDYKKKCEILSTPKTRTGTSITMREFNGDRLKKNNNISAWYIKKILLDNFYMKFYNSKLSGKHISVQIITNIAGKEDKESITISDLPDFAVYKVSETTDLFDKIEIFYNISNSKNDNHVFITALSIDERCMPVEIVANENIPQAYNMIFLLKSESLQGATDESRQVIKIEDSKLNILKTIFRDAIYNIVKTNLPAIAEANKKQFNYIKERFPHYAGLIDENVVGYLSYNDVLRKAQDKYLKEERELLGASKLSDEQYERSIEFSSRSLAAYIVYRQKLIEKMRTLSNQDLESELHNLLSVRYKKYSKDTVEQDLYLNNIWVLDDKFMTYEHVLSEQKMSDVIKVLSPNEDVKQDIDRPDISIFFSNNPEDENTTFDIVIVELKRLGISAEDNSIVEFQLDKRTQALAKYFGSRIQRAWFYGVVDMDDDYRLHLKNNEYKPLFSHGNIYFRTKRIYASSDDNIGVIQNSYILDFKALVEDADSRNKTFLKIITEKFDSKYFD